LPRGPLILELGLLPLVGLGVARSVLLELVVERGDKLHLGVVLELMLPREKDAVELLFDSLVGQRVASHDADAVDKSLVGKGGCDGRHDLPHVRTSLAYSGTAGRSSRRGL
jgi:hypothetical protein